MAIFHMETEQVRSVATQLARASDQIQAEMEAAFHAASNANWMGPSRDQFSAELARLIQDFRKRCEEGTVLAERVENEVREWERLEESGTRRTNSFIEDSRIIFGMIISGEFGPEWKFQYDLKKEKEAYREYWSKLNEDERRGYLEEQVKKMCEKYGLPLNTLEIVDLPDEKGDLRGFHDGNLISLDKDNFENDSPDEILRTIIHEVRHEYQETIVERYQQNGEIPEGLNKSTVEAWQKNNEPGNYIEFTDDPQGYFEQPTERDARIYSTEYVNDYLSDGNWK